MLTSNSIAEQTHLGDKSGKSDKPFCEKIGKKKQSNFFIDIPSDNEEEATKMGQSIDEATCYCHITRSGENKWQINYLFFYPYNADIVDKDNLITATSGTKSIQPFSPYALGSHEGDWEYFAIEYNNEEQKIERAFYSAHDSEGKWYKPGDYPVDAATGQPKVYAANKSHANYTETGIHNRLITLTSAVDIGVNIELPADQTSDQGLQWNCQGNLKFLHQTQPKWLNYNGRWGRFDDPDLLRFGKPPFGPATKKFW
jgi:Plant protein of unknown function (DUF946).